MLKYCWHLYQTSRDTKRKYLFCQTSLVSFLRPLIWFLMPHRLFYWTFLCYLGKLWKFLLKKSPPPPPPKSHHCLLCCILPIWAYYFILFFQEAIGHFKPPNPGETWSRIAAPSTEVVHQDVSWSNQDQTTRQTQETLERLYLSTSLGMSWCSWWWWSGPPCLVCCPWDPNPYKRKLMNGWKVLQMILYAPDFFYVLGLSVLAIMNSSLSSSADFKISKHSGIKLLIKESGQEPTGRAFILNKN